MLDLLWISDWMTVLMIVAASCQPSPAKTADRQDDTGKEADYSNNGKSS